MNRAEFLKKHYTQLMDDVDALQKDKHEMIEWMMSQSKDLTYEAAESTWHLMHLAAIKKDINDLFNRY